MERVAKFSKISEAQFVRDWLSLYAGKQEGTEQAAKAAYEQVKLPVRATKGSAGYDLYTPIDVHLKPGESIKIPTGIRCRMREDVVLLIVPRSSLGFKYMFQLNNTMGVVDSDYFYSDNEGHLFVKMVVANFDGLPVDLHAGQAFAQGIFVHYGITEDDAAEGIRNGGFGSTDRQKQ